MKSARSAISGIIIGIMLTVTATAAVQEYTLKKSECKLMVDGVEVKGELPLLIMDPGYNYIPAAEFRSICDKIGIGFEFDVPTKEVRIETRQAQIETKEVDTVNEPITQTPDGIEIRETKDGIQYLSFIQVKNKAKGNGYNFIFDPKTEAWKIVKGEDIVLDNIPTSFNYGHDSVTVEYYTSTILPLFQ